MFFQRTTDGRKTPVALENVFSGPRPAACWLIGGGPSLSSLPLDEIQATAAPRFAINLAGSGLLRPHFWTSYDPTSRFDRSVYLDPSVMKFVHESRAMDLVPETSFKVCDCPATFFFARERTRGFTQFPSRDAGVTDWQDSLIQAIDVAYRLGFRQLYLAGCEMVIAPGERLRQLAAPLGVEYVDGELLGNFLKRAEAAGLTRQQIAECELPVQYHFDERKPMAAAARTDFHYFRVAQYLRLSRRAISLAGLQLISVTPGSRLNDDFPVMTVAEACDRIHAAHGDPRQEQTRGRYTESGGRREARRSPMRDFRPHFWNADQQKSKPGPSHRQKSEEREQVRAALEAAREVPVAIDEDG